MRQRFSWLLMLALGLLIGQTAAHAQGFDWQKPAPNAEDKDQSNPSSDGSAYDANVRVRLITNAKAITPGQSIEVGIELKHDPHWHTYWVNPGDAGLVTKANWQLPEGFEAGDTQFPKPVHFIVGRDGGYGYEGTVILPVKIDVPSEITQDQIKLGLSLTYLSCKVECIPGKVNVELTLPVNQDTGDASPEPLDAIVIDQKSKADVYAWHSSDGLTLALLDARLLADDNNAQFDAADRFAFYPYVESQEVIDAGQQPKIVRSGDLYVLQLPYEGNPTDDSSIVRDKYAKAIKASSLSGTVFLAAGDEEQPLRYYEINELPITNDVPQAVKDWLKAQNAAEVEEPVAPGTTQPMSLGGYLQAAIFGIIGGMILNLMPCVFPVLAIKVLGFVQQAGQQRSHIILHGLIFTLGVLISMWLLAGIVIGIQASGEIVGWGFQLQNPVFVSAMALLMVLIGLNLAGVFEVGHNVMNAAGQASQQFNSGYMSSLGTGALTVAIATPCAAPFMASAVGVALQSGPVGTLVILSAFGFGLALPYLLLSIFPSWVKLLPKPGAWMETFKQFMAFPMFATAAFLAWLMLRLTDDSFSILMLMIACLVLAFGAWMYGRFGQRSRNEGLVWLGRGAFLLAIPLAMGMTFTQNFLPEELEWEPFSEQAVQAELEAGRPVFVDFTADWCLTCKSNEYLFINTDRVRQAVAKHDVTTFKADFTKEDPKLLAIMNQYGSRTVPFYLFLSPDDAIDPVHFSAASGSGDFVSAIETVAGVKE